MSKIASLIALGLLAVAIVGSIVGLIVVADNMQPPTRTIEDVIPDGKFPS